MFSKDFFDNLILKIKKQGNFLFLAIPLFLILLVIVSFMFVFQGSKKSDRNETLINPSSTPIPTITPTEEPPNNITGGPTIDQQTQKLLDEQEKGEIEFGKQQDALQQQYPWLNSLPLQKDTLYFVYFDVNEKAFIGMLYPKTTSETSIDDQVTSMKKEIQQSLTSLGIPYQQYSLDWTITPEL
jgi:hypothetical protein